MKLTKGKLLRVQPDRKGGYVVVFLLIALISCSGKDAQPTSSPPRPVQQSTPDEPSVTSVMEAPTTMAEAIPRFERGECAAPVTIDLQHHCGWLVVLEDRTKPDGRLVRLPVVIFEAQASDPQPDPVIYLAGGGGADQMGMMNLYSDFVSTVVSERDFIMYNQRGAPLTDPALECEGLVDILWELAEAHPSIEERNLRLTEFWSACRSDLTAQGVDLNMYSTSANAADAYDLRVALGYDKANYYGTSYGTRIGLILLRDWSEGVRSIILDSVYPPDASYYTTYASNVAGGFTSLFEYCRANLNCFGAYGELGTLFTETADRLNAEPETITYESGKVVVDEVMFIDVIYALLQSTPARRAAPSFIKAASMGDLDPFEPVYPALFEYPGSMAVYYSFQCQEEVPKHSFDEVVANAAEVPALIRDYAVQFFAALDYAVCEVWSVQPSAARESASVESEVPALVLAGTVDPITPVQWSRSAAKHLSNGWFYEFPGQSHGTMRTSTCAREVALMFLQDPSTKPDAACVENTS